MPSKRISLDLNQGVYFLTFTIHRWYYLFDRHDRWNILKEALVFAQEKRQLEIFGYVFMLNHVHLLVSSPDVIDFVHGFKRHTHKELKQNILQHEQHILALFHNESGQYRLWQQGNAPKYVESESFFLQKLNYIHFNPVRKQYVSKPEYWHWSSANPKSPIVIDRL